jgi:hypothetical protein
VTKSRKPKHPTKKRARPTSDDNDVGYGKPPRANQFKPGHSGNPKGRPKGAKSEATILHELLQQKIDLNRRGKTRKITILEAMLRRIAEDSLKGNTRSAAFLLNRLREMTANEPDETDLSEDEKTVLETYLKELSIDSKEG